MKKLVAVIVSLLLCFSITVNVSAEGTNEESQKPQLSLFWKSTWQVLHGVSIDSNGYSTSTVNYYTYKNTDKIKLTASLQKLENNGWKLVDSWSATGIGACYLSGSKYLIKGTYRLKTTGTVYNANGTFVETVTVYSGLEHYN